MGLELCLADWDNFFTLVFTFILSSVYTKISLKKKGCKKSAIDSGSPSGLKIIFILLTKIETVYMQSTIIPV